MLSQAQVCLPVRPPPSDWLLTLFPLTVQPLAAQAVVVVALHLGGGDARRTLPALLPVAPANLRGPRRLRPDAPHPLARSPSALTRTPASAPDVFGRTSAAAAAATPAFPPTRRTNLHPGDYKYFLSTRTCGSGYLCSGRRREEGRHLFEFSAEKSLCKRLTTNDK